MGKEKLSTEVLLNKYEEYLSNNKFKSAKVYRQQIELFFSENSSYFVNMSIQQRNFLGLLPGLLCNYDNLIIGERKGKDLIIDIRDSILGKFFNKDVEKTKTKQNLQSYIKKFFDIISDDKWLNYLKKKEYDKVCLTPSDIAVINGEGGEIYLHSTLFTKFKSRLRCQDRTSGDKIWLPLRFIAKIYSTDIKNAKEKEEKKDNAFSQWLNTLVNDIYINYKDGDNVKSVKFSGEDEKKDVHLRINPKKEVYVRWLCGEGIVEKEVLTPTGHGNEKRVMIVPGIQAIAIDHVKPIDRTLRDLEEELDMLKIVSEEYKRLQVIEDAREEKAVKNVLGNSDFYIDKLTEELGQIHKDGLLRLMDSNYNSQKSNGETFQGIYMRKDGSYYGVIETGIKKKDEDGTFTLYQELTDNLNDTGKLTIDKKDNLNGDEVKKIAYLSDIINRI